MTDVTWKHGSPYDRGRADSYYRRPFKPHWVNYDAPPGDERILTIEKGTPEYDQYKQGFNDNEEAGEYKDWG